MSAHEQVIEKEREEVRKYRFIQIIFVKHKLKTSFQLVLIHFFLKKKVAREEAERAERAKARLAEEEAKRVKAKAAREARAAKVAAEKERAAAEREARLAEAEEKRVKAREEEAARRAAEVARIEEGWFLFLFLGFVLKKK